MRFCTNFERELNDGLIALWNEQLADLDPSQLVVAFREVMRTATFFPKIADIRGRITTAEELVLSDQIEHEWQRVLQEFQRWTPDLPNAFHHTFTAETFAAVKAAGGWAALVDMPSTELQWAKKRFAENFRNQGALAATDPELLPAAISPDLMSRLKNELNAATVDQLATKARK